MRNPGEEMNNVKQEINLSNKRTMLLSVFVLFNCTTKLVLFFKPVFGTDFRNLR